MTPAAAVFGLMPEYADARTPIREGRASGVNCSVGPTPPHRRINRVIDDVHPFDIRTKAGLARRIEASDGYRDRRAPGPGR